jgi:hypothetical protein
MFLRLLADSIAPPRVNWEMKQVAEENGIVAEVTFGENSSGAAIVNGAYVGADQSEQRSIFMSMVFKPLNLFLVCFARLSQHESKRQVEEDQLVQVV